MVPPGGWRLGGCRRNRRRGLPLLSSFLGPLSLRPSWRHGFPRGMVPPGGWRPSGRCRSRRRGPFPLHLLLGWPLLLQRRQGGARLAGPLQRPLLLLWCRWRPPRRGRRPGGRARPLTPLLRTPSRLAPAPAPPGRARRRGRHPISPRTRSRSPRPRSASGSSGRSAPGDFERVRSSRRRRRRRSPGGGGPPQLVLTPPSLHISDPSQDGGTS